MTTKEDVEHYLLQIKSKVGNPDRKSNTGPALFDIFLWQEIANLADGQLKRAWAAAAGEGLLKADDNLRKLGEGEHIVVESKSFSCLVKVNAPRQNLDKDAFFASLARKFKVSVEKIKEMAEACSKETKAPLQKRILEV